MNTDSHKIYLIRIDSPEQSKAFQEKLFKTTDIIWRGGQKTPQYFSKELLTIKYYENNYRLFIALMSRYELYKRSDNYIELSVSEIINSERHPFECVLKSSSSGSAEYLKTEFGGQKRGGSIRIRLPNKYTVRETCDTKEQAMNQSDKNMYGHPSEWVELPEGVYPVRFRKFRSSLVEPFNYEFHNTMVSTLNTYTENSYVFTCGEWFAMVEFSNGWIWEAGGRGWRHKDYDYIFNDCGKESWSCLDPVPRTPGTNPHESPKPFIIPLREKVYGRDTHAALMAAHRKREQAAQWTKDRTRKLLSDSGTGDTISCLMRSIGDKLIYDGVEEK